MEGKLRAWLDERWHRVPDPIRRRVQRARTPAGHFYSPYPDLDELAGRADDIFGPRQEFAGIDMRPDAQLALLDECNELAADLPFTDEPSPGLRYYYRNRPYAFGDGLFAACLLRKLQPARYVEIGSGFSTLLALDVRDRFVPDMTITAIDPYPERLRELLDGDDPDGFEIVDRPAQSIGADLVGELRANDVLFIDSTHVAKAGSDVNHIVFELLPAVAPGVHVHVHDIFGNFEYPRDWVFQGRAWSEAYLMRAFLQFNDAFEVVLSTHWLHGHHRDRFGPALSPALVNPGAGLWLRRR